MPTTRRSTRTPSKPKRFDPEAEAAKPQFAGQEAGAAEGDSPVLASYFNKSKPPTGGSPKGEGVRPGSGAVGDPGRDGKRTALPTGFGDPYVTEFPWVAVNRKPDESFGSYGLRLTIWVPLYVAIYTAGLYGLQMFALAYGPPAWASYAGAVAGLEAQTLAYFNPQLTTSATIQAGWTLMTLPHVLLAAAGYLAAVGGLSLLMRGEGEPFDLKGPMILYNAVQVGVCLYMAAETVRQAVLLDYPLVCANPAFGAHDAGEPAATGMSSILWVFYLTKVLDFCDTIFMVLRKKWRQITFLHLFHHVSIFLIYWLNAAAAYNGDVYPTIIANSLVHFVMYGYYLLVALFPGYTPWWKVYVTNLQMVQFLCMISHGCYLLYSCPDPGRRITVLYIGYIAFLFFLFSLFHMKAYGGKAKAKKDT